jgi:hypothetical protein
MATYLVNFVNSLDPNTNPDGVATGKFERFFHS